jgi:hypothetical protein
MKEMKEMSPKLLPKLLPIALMLFLFLSGCAPTIKMVEPGERVAGERMVIALQDHWNHFDSSGFKPAEVWTMEGANIDELLLYSGLKDGQALYTENGAREDRKKLALFQSSMQTEAVVALFERLLTRDGSIFKLIRLEPYPFGGKKGFRFEYERIRNADHLQQQGIGFGAIDRGELFALLYHAPRLAFFPRHRKRFEDLAKNVTIR